MANFERDSWQKIMARSGQWRGRDVGKTLKFNKITFNFLYDSSLILHQ